jgi:hypothetical protein
MHGPKQAKAVSRGSQTRSQSAASVQGLQTTEPEGEPGYDSPTGNWEDCEEKGAVVLCKPKVGHPVPCLRKGEQPFPHG